MFNKRTYNWKEEHKELDHNSVQGVFCTHCGKTVDDRKSLPDYGMFMGGVWIKDNLPCKPYKKPAEDVVPSEVRANVKPKRKLAQRESRESK